MWTKSVIHYTYMNLENFGHEPTSISKADMLASGFRELTRENHEAIIFEKLEAQLEAAGFEVGDVNKASKVLLNNSLFCRSENFSRVMELVLDNKPIELENESAYANMCTMSATQGYKIAMSEGFSGKDVNHALKVVISFAGDHLERNESIPKDNDLWKLKPETAAVSIAGSGEITPEDVKMVSFRFPVHLYPEHLLTEAEQDMLEETGLGFIVRHYTQKETAH